MDQLKGKAVCVGDQGSGTEFNAYQVLEAYGMTADDIEVVHANFGEASEMLKNGQIDAAFTVVAAPTTRHHRAGNQRHGLLSGQP